VPHSIITDNGTNFTSKEFKNYCEGMGIKLKFASVAHPKTNGQVEKANGLICNGIKKRLLAPLEKAKHAWVDVKGICPRGNNNIVIIIFLVHDNVYIPC
jgi:transposase InsO family protein